MADTEKICYVDARTGALIVDKVNLPTFILKKIKSRRILWHLVLILEL